MLAATIAVLAVGRSAVAQVSEARPGAPAPAAARGRTLVRCGHLLDVKTGAIRAGVKVALGTDAAVYPHGLNAADLMGWTDKVGSIAPGKWADVIAVSSDPLKDVRVLQHVAFVMKSGVVYKDEAQPALVKSLSEIEQPVGTAGAVSAL